MKRKKLEYQRYIGIDVAKQTLEIADSAGAIPESLENDTEIILKHLKQAIESPSTTLLICEATGGYERKLVAAAHALGIAIVVANPRQVRDFAKGAGILEKSDPIDAEVLRVFGEDARGLTLATAKPEAEEELASLSRRRKQLLQMINQENNRLQQTTQSQITQCIEELLKSLKKQLKTIEAMISKQLQQRSATDPKVAVISSVPGVGMVTTATMLSELPELGRLSRGLISKLVGVAPLVRQSGQQDGQRSIFGGRGYVRRVLYMATLVATRHNPTIKSFYQRLLANGKIKKVALVAAMRKLLTILNEMVRNGEVWRSAELSVEKNKGATTVVPSL